MRLLYWTYDDYEYEISYLGKSILTEPFWYSLHVSRILHKFRSTPNVQADLDSSHRDRPCSLRPCKEPWWKVAIASCYLCALGIWFLIVFLMSFMIQVTIPEVFVSIWIDSSKIGCFKVQHLRCRTSSGTRSNESHLVDWTIKPIDSNIPYPRVISLVMKYLRRLYILLNVEYHLELRGNILLKSSILELEGTDIILKNILSIENLWSIGMGGINVILDCLVKNLYSEEKVEFLSAAFKELQNNHIFSTDQHSTQLTYGSIRYLAVQVCATESVQTAAFLYLKETSVSCIRRILTKGENSVVLDRRKISAAVHWNITILRWQHDDLEVICHELQMTSNFSLESQIDIHTVTIAEVDVIRLDSSVFEKTRDLSKVNDSVGLTRVLRPIIHFKMFIFQFEDPKYRTDSLFTCTKFGVSTIKWHVHSLYRLIPSEKNLSLFLGYYQSLSQQHKES